MPRGAGMLFHARLATSAHCASSEEPPTCHCASSPPAWQLCLQYRVAQDRLYEAFYSMDDPQAQVTSYGEWVG